MRRVLLAWIGVTDLRAPEEEAAVGLGPIAQALDARPFDEVVLLAYFAKRDHAAKVEPYVRWLATRTKAEVKLLRVLQERAITKLGTRTPEPVDVRIIAATNRTLADEVAVGRFREDLFYRLAVAVLKIPPLRDRQGDLGFLIDRLLAQVNREADEEPGYREKKLSPSARNVLLGHTWPGNVRELLNTLQRAAIWSEGPTISAEDVREALLPAAASRRTEILRRQRCPTMARLSL